MQRKPPRAPEAPPMKMRTRDAGKSHRDVPLLRGRQGPAIPALSRGGVVSRRAHADMGQAVGRARHRPAARGGDGAADETEVRKLYEQDCGILRLQRRHAGPRADAGAAPWPRQLYESLGIKVHYITWPDDPPRSAYGPMKRSISAAAGFVINGGAIIPREATPYWRGRSRYVAQFLIGSAARSSTPCTAPACARSARRRG